MIEVHYSCIHGEDRLGVGFIGSGFMTRFHIRSWEAVRDADVRGIYSPTRANAEDAAALARSLRVGDARAFESIEAMVADPVDRLHLALRPELRARRRTWKRIVARDRERREAQGDRLREAARPERRRSRAHGRTGRRGRRPARLSREPAVHRQASSAASRSSGRAARPLAGRPYLARAAEEHGGPHMPWFWQGDLQGGGVLNDMMCHSLEVGRYLLTKPGAPRDSIRPLKVSAQIASLKWSRPEYVRAAARHDDRQGRLRQASRRGLGARDGRLTSTRPARR